MLLEPLSIPTFDPDTYIFRRIADHALGPVDSALIRSMP